jgi:hypothetical protein
LALHYASLSVALLLGILPTLMAWQTRRMQNTDEGHLSHWSAPGGTIALWLNGAFFLAITIIECQQLFRF